MSSSLLKNFSADYFMLSGMEPMEALRDFVIRRRAELKLTQRSLAAASGLDPGTVAGIEVGRVTKSPRGDTLAKLAKGLRVDPEVLNRIARGEEAMPAEKPTVMNDEEARAFVEMLLTLSPERKKAALDHLLYLKHLDEQAKGQK